MHHLCRKTLTRVAVTSWPSRSSGCGSAKCHRGQCTGPSRNFARVTNLDTSMEQHPQPCARIQSHTTGAGYQSNLSPQVNDTVTGARRDMDMPSIPDILAHYDWRTFAPPNAQLHYIRSEDVTNQRLARLVSRPGPFTIGLDFEWRPTFVARQAENPISLVQVACDDEILLVQVSAMEGELILHMWSCPRVTLGALPVAKPPHHQGFPPAFGTFWSRGRARKLELASSASGLVLFDLKCF